MNGWKLLSSTLVLIGLCRPALAAPPKANAESTSEDREFFESQVRPLLVARCHKCHGPTRGKGNLSLTSRSEIIAGGDSGPVVVPGKPEESLLIEAIRYGNDQLQMPPDGKLPEEDIARLERWIQAGATWTEDNRPAERPARKAQQTDEIAAAGRNFWSFQPLGDPAPPTVQNEEWPGNAVDRFILSRLEERGIRRTSLADKRTLLRRATFDLTGLPPTPEETADFLADESPEAFVKVVERLLASPRYGERWGRHWLDVVRYADARDLIQLPADSDFREAWRYRDWVVEAFNRDLPYDKFIRMQIAGDLLQPTDPEEIDKDGLIATGLLAIADFVPGDVDKERMIADYVNDQIDVVGRAVLGLTLACARCHDHKFDPISTEDYYALAGIFFSTRLIPGPVAGNTPLVRAALLPPSELRAIEQETARVKHRSAELAEDVRVVSEREYRAHAEQLLQHETEQYLLAAGDYLLLPADGRPPISEFAVARELEELKLNRWLKYFADAPHPALPTHLATAGRDQREKSVQEIAAHLQQIFERRRTRLTTDPVAQALADAELFSFRADDPRMLTDNAGQISLWPDHAGISDDVARVDSIPGPIVATTADQTKSRTVVRFHGQELLEARRGVPACGTVFVVFRPDTRAGAGQRLIGWEDSAVGQHGLGLMCDANGSLQAIVRHNGTNGDVVAPSAPGSDFQLVVITWGPAGVSLHRNGELIATNHAIDAVSSDPAITALRIGGPGSGPAAKFSGDLTELRVYAQQLDEVAQKQVEAEVRQRWFGDADQGAEANRPIEDLYDELLSPRGPFWVAEEQREQVLPEESRARLAALRRARRR